jgi:hypothetical protein
MAGSSNHSKASHIGEASFLRQTKASPCPVIRASALLVISLVQMLANHGQRQSFQARN